MLIGSQILSTNHVESKIVQTRGVPSFGNLKQYQICIYIYIYMPEKMKLEIKNVNYKTQIKS